MMSLKHNLLNIKPVTVHRHRIAFSSFNRVCIVSALIMFYFFCQVSFSWAAQTGSVIIENNLFDPDRTKWSRQKKKKPKKSEKPKPRKNLANVDRIVLFGTVLSDKKCAVLNIKGGKGKRDNDLYMIGDYIGGYLVSDITEKKVVLTDEYSDQQFNIFVNEGKKRRKAVKTKITKESWKKPENQKKRSAKKKSTANRQKKVKPKKARTAAFLKKRFEKTVKILKRTSSRLVKKQGARDYKRLKRLFPFMSEDDRREIIKLKKQFDAALKN